MIVTPVCGVSDPAKPSACRIYYITIVDAQSNHPVDVHGRKLHCKEIEKKNPDGLPYYEVPMRALIVRDLDNLMVAGRNLGAEFVAQSSIRIIPACRAMDEAADVGTAIACREPNVSLHSLDGVDVRAEMRRRDAPFAQAVRNPAR